MTKNIFLKPPFQDLQQYMMKNPKDNLMILNTLSHSLKDMDLLKACCASYLCGCIIPDLKTEDAGIPIIELFAKVIPLIYQYFQSMSKLQKEQPDLAPKEGLTYLFQTVPDTFKAYFGCEWLNLAVMEVITKEPASRIKLREYNLFKAISRLQKLVKHINYIVDTYYACSKLPILLLSPETEQGITLEVNDLCNNFHLITLIEAELFRSSLADSYRLKDYVFDEAIYQYATGRSMPDKNYSISAHQQYYTLDTLLWGEGTPDDIPRLDEYGVLILDSKNMFASRTWDVNFILKCHDNLNPYVKITGELKKDDVIQLINRLPSLP